MSTMRGALSLLVLGLSFAMAQQSPVIVPESHPAVAGGNIDAYKNIPPDLKITPAGPGGRTGQLWVRNTGNALLIAGQVDGSPPDFPRNQAQILSKDHIEVWLAATTDVPMPPIGWGNQFGEQLLPRGADSCADWMKDQNPDAEELQKCKSWVAQQQQYRIAFKKLFVRQWLLTADFAVESYATPAYELIAARYDPKSALTAPLKPKGKVQMWQASGGAGHGYTFQIQIPYNAFPPVNTTDLQNLWLMVDVFNAAPAGKKMGAFSSSSPLRAFGKPDTFNQLQLKPGRSFSIVPCSVGLDGTDKYGEKHPGWFFPREQGAPGNDFPADTFIIVNEAEGYAYQPDGLSPVVRPIHHFWHAVSKDEWICGPQLVYQKGQSAKHYDRQLTEQGLDARRLADGTLLIKSGPQVYYSEFGSGQCGACPRYAFDMFALDKNLNLVESLSLGGVVQGDDDAADFSISRDWLQVVAYQQQKTDDQNPDAAATWAAINYCLKGTKYEKCGEKKNVKPPEPSLLKELRDYGSQM